MATLTNYAKKCSKCHGKYFIGEIPGKPFWGIFRGPDTILTCGYCLLGIVHPVKIISKPGHSEPEIIYPDTKPQK